MHANDFIAAGFVFHESNLRLLLSENELEGCRLYLEIGSFPFNGNFIMLATYSYYSESEYYVSAFNVNLPENATVADIVKFGEQFKNCQIFINN